MVDRKAFIVCRFDARRCLFGTKDLPSPEYCLGVGMHIFPSFVLPLLPKSRILKALSALRRVSDVKTPTIVMSKF